MGVVTSCCIPRRSCNCRSSGSKGVHRGKRNLSATFNLSVIDDDRDKKSGLVNINVATEEELMTLRGIDRATAKNIVDHRNRIEGFRSVEDIALVSGVGAAKYTQICGDIYIPSPDGSPIESRPEGDRNAVHNASKYSLPIVSVNTANIFSLIRVRGIGISLAKNIVEYRDKNGKFNCIDELKKVKGIGPMLLDSVKLWLTVEDRVEKKLESATTNGKTHGTDIHHENKFTHDIGDKRKYTPSIENLLEFLGPLAQVPSRPEVKPVMLEYKNKKVFRLATWNLKRFTKEKVSNPGVKDVVCMTILENRFGIVAIQELGCKDALQEICQELNSPTLPNVKKWKGKRGKWKCAVSNAAGRMFQSMEYHGFLFDESQNIELISSSLLEAQQGQEKPFTRMPFLAVFKINDAFDCVIVSVHLKATGLEDEDKKRTEAETDKLHEVIDVVHRQIQEEDDVIILGDFNLDPDSKAFDDLKHKGYMPCFSSDTFTNISSSNPEGNESYDNIWLSRQTRCLMAGKSCVIREGLSSPWIPDGWSWGGIVSDHCPIYTQLYSCIDSDKDGDVTLAKHASFLV